MRYHRKKSKCPSCPLWRGSEKTCPGIGPAHASLIFLGEAPGVYEVKARLPFQGSAGNLFNNWLSRCEMTRHHTYVTNVLCCQLTGNKTGTIESAAAIDCCRDGLFEELSYVAVDGAVLVPMGQTAWETIFPDQPYDKITYARGGVYDWELSGKRFQIIPTFHPQYYGYNEHSLSSFAIWEADGRKIKRVWKGGRIPYPLKRYSLFPGFKEAIHATSHPAAKEALFCIDTETDNIDSFEANLKLFGFAWSVSDAMCIPFGKDGFNGDEPVVKASIECMLNQVKQVYHHVIYDAIVIEGNGITFNWDNLAHDTMVLSHVLNPELRHNLGFVGSIYADIPYHKNQRGSKDVTAYRTYNLDDCTSPLRCLPAMLKDLKERGLEDLYYNERLKVLKPFARMIQRGIKLDKKRLEAWTREQHEKKAEYEAELRRTGHLPEAFNLDSPSDLRLFLFQDRDAKFDRAERELQKRMDKRDQYEKEFCSLRNEYGDALLADKHRTCKQLQKKMNAKERQIARLFNAKCHKELEALVSLLNIQPLYPAGSFSGRKTKTKKEMKTDEQNLLSFRNYLNRKLATLKTPAKKKEVETLLNWLSLYTKYTRVGTLISNYSGLDKWISKKDGRVHCSINPNGTRTGRPAFSDPNLGTLPKKRGKSLREAFVPENGYIFVSADYSNAEFIALAYITKDPELIRVVEQGLNIHDENTRNIYGITPDHPNWEKRRDPLKIFQFGHIQYGGSTKEIYQKLMIENPDLKMSFPEFEEMSAEYFRQHPVQKKWIDDTQALALEKRITKTPMGFIRTLYGNERDIKKQAINTPVQGCIAHLINRAMIRIEDRMEREVASNLYDAKMILQIYDQLIFEAKEGDESSIIPMIVEEMEKPVDIYGTMVSFPVDVSVGYSLGTLKEYSKE